MDEKKVREAIYCMKSFADDTVCEECDNYDRCDHTMVANNARTAIEALEKQLAILKVDVWANGTEHCPVCDKNITYTGLHVCPECRQRLG